MPNSPIQPLPHIANQPTKKRSVGETITCQTLSEIYQRPFTSVRPDFLRNPETGRNLELDCYNDELKIAAEYNGYQHVVYPNRYHRTLESFLAQVRRDHFKIESCDRNGVYLITIPHTIPYKEIPTYIREQLAGIDTPSSPIEVPLPE